MKSLLWLESSTLSIWLRESLSLLALPGMLFLHTLAMGLLAGTCVVLCLRTLGIAAKVPLAALRDFIPIIRVSMWASVASGLLLLIAYPTKAVTNPVFYFKLSAIALALATWRGVARNFYATDDSSPTMSSLRARRLAAWSLLAWFTAIALGRLLAYTYRYLSAEDL